MSRSKYSEQNYYLGNQLASRIILESPARIAQYGAGMVQWAELWQARHGSRPPAARGVEQTEPTKGQLNLFRFEPKGIL
jgi:hypothetical protein